jgi:hypothetical protein
MELPSASNLFAGILFGAIGLAAFLYGKKALSWKPMVIGVVLMVYPYFIDTTWLLYLIGVALSASLFIFRD